MSQAAFIYGYYFDQSSPNDTISSLDTLESNRPYWLHFDYTKDETKQWLEQQEHLNPVVISALLNDETRPRATMLNDGVLLSLRG